MGTVHKRQSEGSLWRWGGVEVEAYDNDDEAASATKQVLIGAKDGAENFVVRFFAIPPRGFSNLDFHQHDHGVIVMSGRGRVMINGAFTEIGPGDVVYIASWEQHQFENLTDEPFTFICVIPPKTAQPHLCLLPSKTREKVDPVNN